MKVCFIFLLCLAGGLSQRCGPNEFPCHNGDECIPECWLCDGVNDCGDNSDESPEYCNVEGCLSHQFECDNGETCICPTWLCDGYSDCMDGTDENGFTCPCPGPEGNYTRCETGECILKDHYCDLDGICDCPGCEDQRPSNCNATVQDPAKLHPFQMDRKRVGVPPGKPV